MHGLGAHREYRWLVDALRNQKTRQTRLVWFHLTSFLSHAAMISKYLSPKSKSETAVARKKALCNLLHVDLDSEVLPRDARNNIEHFDERIDNWIGNTNQNILEIVLQNRAGYEYMRVAEKRVKRVLILEELVFISEKNDGSKFELTLEPLREEVERINTGADQWIAEHSPHHFIHPR